MACAIYGEMRDPRELGEPPQVETPKEFIVDDSMILPPAEDPSTVDVVRGPNIKPLPIKEHLPATLDGRVLIKLGDNITTDHITPAGSWLKYRSNVPKYAESVFSGIDEKFHEKAKAAGGGFVVGGENYGQGSSREHAALCPMYLGIKAVVAKSFARIHRDNLINFGILPLVFQDPADYNYIDEGDHLELTGLDELSPDSPVTLKNHTKATELELNHNLTERQIEILRAGGKLNYTKAQRG